jgi:hypothetical protein
VISGSIRGLVLLIYNFTFALIDTINNLSKSLLSYKHFFIKIKWVLDKLELIKSIYPFIWTLCIKYLPGYLVRYIQYINVRRCVSLLYLVINSINIIEKLNTYFFLYQKDGVNILYRIEIMRVIELIVLSIYIFF